MSQLAERPIFIVGSPRSGTTLLRYVLSSHPRIEIPPETGFIPFLGRDYTGKLNLAQVKHVLRRIGELNHEWRDLGVDAAAFFRLLEEPTLANVFDRLYRIRIAGAERWGDKTPGYVLYLPLLNRIFPSAQFIHMIRDGRDVTISAARKWGHKRWHMDSYYLLKNWVHHVETGRRTGSMLGAERYLEVRYETLVQRPRPSIERICNFLGESFHPAMLDHARVVGSSAEPSGHPEVQRPITASSVGKWKEHMSAFDRKLSVRVAGPTLMVLGYEVEDIDPLTILESGRLALLAGKYGLVEAVRRFLVTANLWGLNRGKRSR